MMLRLYQYQHYFVTSAAFFPADVVSNKFITMQTTSTFPEISRQIGLGRKCKPIGIKMKKCIKMTVQTILDPGF